VVQALVKCWPKIKEAGTKLLVQLGEGLGKIGSTIANAVAKIWNAIKTGLTEKIEKIKEIGKNILQGLIDGLKSMFTAVGDTVKNIAGSIADGFKSFFGIKSPSKLFASYGEYLDEGLANGIESGQSVVTNAMDGLNESLVGDIQTTASVGYDSGYDTRKVSTNSDSGLYELLSKYLPYLAQGSNVNISLEGDAGDLFNIVKRANNEFKKQNGRSAFA